MSKIRQQGFSFPEELPPPANEVVNSFIAYTSRKEGAPHRYAGYINAPDIDLALEYACEHYGQDEECTSIWIHEVKDLTETPCADESVDPTSGSDAEDSNADPEWVVFTQKHRGDIHIETGLLHAPNAENALSKAIARHGEGTVQIRVVPRERIDATAPDQVIWRMHDQTYRLARGYSKLVRTKWAAVRKAEDIDEYRKDDIEHHF
jgi:1,2-phenylacetyl-CoA epoxidase PaaB subunit